MQPYTGLIYDRGTILDTRVPSLSAALEKAQSLLFGCPPVIDLVALLNLLRSEFWYKSLSYSCHHTN